MNPYKMDPTQAEHEARAKIFWGDPPEDVVNFLRVNGMSYEEASDTVDDMFEERASSIRGTGLKKALLGIGLMLLPVGYLIFSVMIGVLLFWPLALTVMAGVWGAFKVLKGSIMFFFPYSEPGEIANQSA